MIKNPQCDRCLFYCYSPYLVCSVHPNGVDSDCLDFRADPKIQEEEQWSPQGYFWYNGELREIRTSQLTSQQKLEILDTHPFFTGQCPNCGHQFNRCNIPMIHWDCPICFWVDDSV